MKHSLKLLVVITILLLNANSCSIDNESLLQDKVVQCTLNQDEQNCIEQDTLCITTEIARVLTLQELGEDNPFLEIKGDFVLSEHPRVIWAYDNRPKYYEFDVIQENKVVATITTFAQKEEEACIAYIFNEPLQRNYNKGLDMYEGFYPTVFWGKRGKYGNKPLFLYKEDGTTIIDEIPSIYEDERYEQILSKMDIKSATQARNIIIHNRELRLKRNAQVLEYWNKKLYNDTSLNNGYISYVSPKDNSGIHSDDLTSGTPNNYYVIPAFNNEQLKKTSWSGPCGPSAVAWVYRGLYSYYPCTSTNSSAYIRKYGDSKKQANVNNNLTTIFFNTFNESGVYYDRAKYYYSPYCLDIYNKVSNNVSQQIDNGLYERLLDHTVKTGSNYPMYQAGMNNAIKEITNNEYSITTTTQSRSYIKNNHLPVFIMIGTGDNFHYIVAFGTGNTGTKNYIYVTDNGTYISGNSYYPYWRYEGSNYGIRYKLKK